MRVGGSIHVHIISLLSSHGVVHRCVFPVFCSFLSTCPTSNVNQMLLNHHFFCQNLPLHQPMFALKLHANLFNKSEFASAAKALGGVQMSALPGY